MTKEVHLEGPQHPRTDMPSTTLKVHISKQFMLLSWVSCMALAFTIGRIARIVILINPQRQLLEEHHRFIRESDPGLSFKQSLNFHEEQKFAKLPNPVLKNGKLPPPTTYTAKNFDTAKSTTINSRWVVTEGSSHMDGAEIQHSQCEGVENQCSSTISKSNGSFGGEEKNDDDEVHLPVGQHLLMDIRNVDGDFLDSEERLAKAMLDVVGECGLTLLSYHCHGLDPSGVSCVGVLLESHVSFHTWPAEGVITLDLFTCGPNSLLPIVATVETLFGVPRQWATQLVDMPETIWAYKVRGFGVDDPDTTAELTDLFTFPIGAMTEYKKEIASTYIGADRVDIYDVLRPSFQNLQSYKRSLSDDGSYEAQNRDVFKPDRIVFINGVLQSRRSGEASFYELLVHPAMFAHNFPKHVGVVGFGDGAILREILKHNTVEKVVLIDSQEQLLNLTKRHFPEYHDCSFLLGATNNCLEDPRVTMFNGEASAWTWEENEIFDVVIMDDLELIRTKEDTGTFAWHVANSLSENGILVASTGEAPSRKSPHDDVLTPYISALIDVGFESIHEYEESHVGFGWPWRFTLALKSFHEKSNWFRNEALMNIVIHDRTTPTVDGSSPFFVIDGATQLSIMYPSRASETVYCRPKECPVMCRNQRSFDPDISNVILNAAMEIQTTKDSNPATSYKGLPKLLEVLYFGLATLDLLERMLEGNLEIHRSAAIEFALRYGHSCSGRDELGIFAPSSVNLSIQSGCREGKPFSISDIPSNNLEAFLARLKDDSWAYNPAAERLSPFADSGAYKHSVAVNE